MENGSVLDKIRALQERVECVEKELTALREGLDELESALAEQVVMTYVIEGKTYEITQAEIDDLQARMVKPRSVETLSELVLTRKMAPEYTKLPEDERKRRFLSMMEAVRAEAIADGTAYEHDWEAVADIGD